MCRARTLGLGRSRESCSDAPHWTMDGLNEKEPPGNFPQTRGALSVSGVLDMAPADAAGGEGEGAPFTCRLPAGKDVFAALPTPTTFDTTLRRRGVNRPGGRHPSFRQPWN